MAVSLVDLLQRHSVLVADGGMGTMLFASGLERGSGVGGASGSRRRLYWTDGNAACAARRT